MPSLFIVVDHNEKFSLPLLQGFLRTCSGVRKVEESKSKIMLLEGEFFDGSDNIQFYLDRELDCVSMDDRGETSARLCLMLGDFYPKPLRIFDEGYNFEFSLQGFRTPEELHRAIVDASKS